MAWIEERPRSDGSTSYKVCWRDPDTKLRDSETFDSERAAEKFELFLEANGHRRSLAIATAQQAYAHGPTVTELVSEHIDLLTAAGPDTAARYRRDVARHVTPTIGGYRVSDVTWQVVTQWVQHLAQLGLAPKTIANKQGLLSAAFTTGIRLGYRPDNPCIGVKTPKTADVREMTILTREEVAAVLDVMPEYWRVVVRTLVGTGLRWGEATALTAADLNTVGTPTVRVTKAWKSGADGRPYVGPPKTPRARRTVSLPTDLAGTLKELRRGRGDLLLTGKTGEAVRNASFRANVWLPAIAKSGVELSRPPRLHDLRHTHASWMLAGGMGIYSLQYRLGHESIKTTIDRYSHMMPEQHLAAAKIAETALAGI
ncbi:site-specific integrase [Saxibacter everestensis]|uniref:Site-specific integrase n=1 Tax=Saxibacter everestensis TaxID=2909229 RepID=A0ABY8QUN1_9MICO|nr:site-specific integrase [Brevibacteriaceae bacterium ZFBP1038]